MAAEDASLAAEVDEQIASVEERLAELEEQRLFSGPLRRRRRARDASTRRRRHRRAGLGRDGAADADALGGAARLSGRAARGEPGRGSGHQVGHVPRRRARTPTGCSAPSAACTGSCACRRSTRPTAARRASPASRWRRSWRTAGEVEIDEDDLQVDTYRASGAGGQHVNKTDSAVRITHRPTGIVVQCQNERSQSSNRATAMAMLRAKLLERAERERQEEIAREKGEAQDVNFGSQIRSYVLHPYTMVKDHRTGEEMGDVQRVLDGDLDGFVRAYSARSGCRRGARRWRSSTRSSGARCRRTSGRGDVTTEATVPERRAGARADHAEGAGGDLRPATRPRRRSRCSTPTCAVERLVRGGRLARGRRAGAGGSRAARGRCSRASAPR